jgi:1,2-diacylglycerol 3-alpha-glucosyltransferase
VRVAVFTNTYLPTINGVANVIEAYRESLTDDGHEVYVFAPNPGDPDLDSRANILRFPAVEAPTQIDYHLAMPFSLPIMRTLHGTSFDIVHTHHPLWVGVWGQWYAQWANLPLVTTVHTEYQIYSDLVRLPGTMVEDYLTNRVVKYSNKCHLVTTPVTSMRSKLCSAGVKTLIELLPNPTDLSLYASADGRAIRRGIGAEDDDIVIGFIGRLSAEKNLSFVLHAARLILEAHPRCQLLMVGSGSVETELRQLADELGISDRTHFAGETPHSEIPDYQAAIDIFLTASLSETQPLAYTEAMAVGTAIVAVKAPGSQDMIEHMQNGILVELGEGPQGMAAAVDKLLGDPRLRADISRRAKCSVQRYDIGPATDRLVELYHKAIELHNRAAGQK